MRIFFPPNVLANLVFVTVDFVPFVILVFSATGGAVGGGSVASPTRGGEGPPRRHLHSGPVKAQSSGGTVRRGQGCHGCQGVGAAGGESGAGVEECAAAAELGHDRGAQGADTETVLAAALRGGAWRKGMKGTRKG
eukprot:1426762-Pyramimonas_sp.AAC.1